uniref:Uncharacterized protein n=1 Tax=viral metagenome TaxID=1070528 RepID=A0A6C0BZH1_9ZZZZ
MTYHHTTTAIIVIQSNDMVVFVSIDSNLNEGRALTLARSWCSITNASGVAGFNNLCTHDGCSPLH